jgi:2'-5' RNA ligase
VDDRPLILSLRLDTATYEHLDRLRRAHFPPERNHLAAHLTLFHAIPASLAEDVQRRVFEATRRPPVPLTVTDVYSLGRGVAYRFESDELSLLRESLAGHWYAHLTTQDRQRLRPHVTVQNKVDAAEARALLMQLRAEFQPWSAWGGWHRYLALRRRPLATRRR